MKCSIIIPLFCLFALSCGAKEDKEDSSNSDSLFGELSKSFGEVVRDAQMRVLSYTEQMLDQTTELHDEFQEFLASARNSSDQRSSNVKKALRYFKQRARRMREDIEDEIEAEKEKAESLDGEEKKESEGRIKKLTDALGKLREVRRTRKIIRSIKDTPIFKRVKERLNRRHQKKPEAEPSTTETPEIETAQPKNFTGLIDVQSGGDGFGRHMSS